MSLKRKCFSVEEKMGIIQRLEAGERNGTLAKEFNVCHTTIATINKDKEKIRDLFNRNILKRKRAKPSTQDQVDKALLQWIIMQRSRGIPLTGPQLQEKANFFAKQFKIEDFNCSASWISRFKVRHNILISGDNSDASEWLTKVWPIIRKDFSDDQIFNADETGLFYRLAPDQALKFEGEKCTGGQLSKERITLLLAANMNGTQKQKILVIGTSKRPRCINNIQPLPVDYYNNNWSWMTSEIFTSWVREWDAELNEQNKKILLLVNYSPVHPTINDLCNITLVFLPSNTASVLKPMEQGIIRVIKSTYRKNLLLKVMKMEENKNKSYPKITIQDAILMINDAWEQLSSATIANCFMRSGLAEYNFDTPHSIFSKDIEIEDDFLNPQSVWEIDLRNQLSISKEDLNEYILIDNAVAICEELSEDNIVKNILDDSQNNEDNDGDDNEDDEEPAPSVSKALQAADILNRFIQSNFNDENLTDCMSRINNAVHNYFTNTLKTSDK